MKTKQWTEQEIRGFHPCSAGLGFAAVRKFDLYRVWQECERGDWLIWLLDKTNNIDKAIAVRLAIECARHVLPIYEVKSPGDKRPREAIQAAEKWSNQPTEENKKFASAAYPAAYSAYSAASAATYASAAAASAAAASASAASAAAAADASAAAAAAVASASAAAAASAYAASASAASAAAAADAAAAAAAAVASASAAAAASAYAAYAAAASAYSAAGQKEQTWQANKIRELIPNPFKKVKKQIKNEART